MGIRVRPLEIRVPEGEPFKHDLLGRRIPAGVLTDLVSSIEGPCVIAVDAAWGAGKTTFLRMWRQHLRDHEFPVVAFNAWETDFSGEPFVALSAELTERLQGQDDESVLRETLSATRSAAKEVMRKAVPGLLRLATAGVLDVSPLIDEELAAVVASYAEDRLQAYEDGREAIAEFRRTLEELADSLQQKHEGRPLIIMIDELDRCRPTYATELLEVAKHLFTVDHLIFVLAIDRSELTHSMRAIYGSDFDARGYLRRFFDVDYLLPEPKREAFINATIEAVEIDSYFDRTKDSEASTDRGLVRELLQDFFSSEELSLRQIAHAIHRLGLVLASLPNDKRSFAVTSVVFLILRTVTPEAYKRFVRGEASPSEVLDAAFDLAGTRDLRDQHRGHLFEATVILAGVEMDMKPRILRQYEELWNSEEPVSGKDRAEGVLGLVRALNKKGVMWGGVGFRHAVERLELFSPSLGKVDYSVGQVPED